MSFDPQPSVTRNPHVREIEITMLRTVEADHPEGPQFMRFRITVYDQFDQPMNHVHGDLVPYLTPAIQTQLFEFMDWIWLKAENEVTP